MLETCSWTSLTYQFKSGGRSTMMSQFTAVWRNLNQSAQRLKTGAREVVATKVFVLLAGLALGSYFTESVDMLVSGSVRPLDEISFVGVSLTLLPAVSVLVLVILLQKAKRG